MSNMYPSIPIEETLQLVLEELLIDESLSQRTEWKPHDIVKLTRICMETHFKTYEGYVLTQTDGSPIGKSFSGCICGIFVTNFEKKFVLHNVDTSFLCPLLWKRAEDAVYCIWQHGPRKADMFLNFINSRHLRIKWTKEMQNEQQILPFLDMSIQLENNQLITKVYRKSTHTLRYSHFRSNRPKEDQLNNLKGLLHRAEKICDRECDKVEEKQLLSNAFIACGFPVSDVDRIVQSYKPKTEEEKLQERENLNKLDKMYLPYIPRVSNKLKKQLRKLNIHVVFKRGRTIGSILCNNKPKNTNDKRKNVIYRILCECRMVYFGETGQWFDARVQQHQTAVKKLDVKNGIAAHVQQTGHTVRWSEAKCIDQHNYYVNRKMKEAIYINAYAPGEGNFGCLMNNDLGSHIDPIWKAISSVIQDSVKRKDV